MCKYVGVGAFDHSLIEDFKYYSDCITFDESVFFKCHSLKSFLRVDGSSTSLGDSCYIGKGCFSNCENIKNVELPSKTKYLGNECFYQDFELEKIVLPEGIDTISINCFSNCRNLREINLENIVLIRENGFKSTSLERINASKKLIYAERGAFMEIGNLVDVTALNGNDNFKFGEECFAFCKSLKSFSVPMNMEDIPKGAFKNCKLLNTIVFNGPIYSIGDEAFFGTGFTSFELPKTVKTIGSLAFADINRLSTFSVQKGNHDFAIDEANEMLVTVQYPYTVIKYFGKTNKTVEIPIKYTKIASGAFSNHREIHSIKFNYKIDEIGKYAFGHCTGLTGNVSIPRSVLKLDDETFNDCSNVEEFIQKSAKIYMPKVIT